MGKTSINSRSWANAYREDINSSLYVLQQAMAQICGTAISVAQICACLRVPIVDACVCRSFCVRSNVDAYFCLFLAVMLRRRSELFVIVGSASARITWSLPSGITLTFAGLLHAEAVLGFGVPHTGRGRVPLELQLLVGRLGNDVLDLVGVCKWFAFCSPVRVRRMEAAVGCVSLEHSAH